MARWMRRTDARAAGAVGALLLLGLAVQGLLLYAFLATEGLEEADRWVEHSLEAAVSQIDAGASLEAAASHVLGGPDRLGGAMRRRGQGGSVVGAWGDWPTPERALPARTGDDPRHLWKALEIDRSYFLVGSAPLASGGTLELALPLEYFAGENAEVARAIALATLASGLLALLVAALATSRAFQPLRHATALLRDLDASGLGRRIPTRGTGDPVDVHAETLNRVLARIDAAFGRLRAFSSDVAHELRTPLNRIVNVSEVALLGDEEAGLREALESIQATTQELAGTVKSLLLLAEIDDERLVLRRQAIDVAAWLAGAVALFEPLYQERDVKLGSGSERVTLEGDRVLLDRLLANLLENALRYTPAGGRVELGGSLRDGRVRIRVDDSGPGVPAGERERIFERFARIHHADARAGAGVGLALARAIARAHGGDLTVEPSDVLGGACFVLTLPAAP